MLVKVKSKRYRLPSDHPYAVAIEALAREYVLTRGASGGEDGPERNDIKRVWRELNSAHKELLRIVAERPGGLPQADLERLLGLDWKGLRGVHNGLARICDRIGVEKPVQTTGYNAENRTYHMLPNVGGTIRNLAQRTP